MTAFQIERQRRRAEESKNQSVCMYFAGPRKLEDGMIRIIRGWRRIADAWEKIRLQSVKSADL